MGGDKMKHPKKLSNYLDGQVTDAVKHRIEEHLKSCLQCRSFVEQYKLMSRDMKQLADYKVPSYFAARVIAKAREGATESFWAAFEFVPQRLVKALVVVSAILIIAASFGPRANSTEQATLLPVADAEINENLETPDEVLQFALNAPQDL